MPTHHTTHIYRQARVRARHLPAVVLRRRERRFVAQARQHPPSPVLLAQLAAVRAELRARTGHALTP
jgi:hypothetical protein